LSNPLRAAAYSSAGRRQPAGALCVDIPAADPDQLPARRLASLIGLLVDAARSEVAVILRLIPHDGPLKQHLRLIGRRSASIVAAGVDLMLREAAEHYDTGRPEPADALCNDILNLRPDYIPALHLAAVIACFNLSFCARIGS
jgi:hypothetical protein